MHPRETVRESFVALIKAANTAAGDNVFNMRDFNFFVEIMPSINISTQSERIEDGHDYGLRRRVLTVDVECYATGGGGARCVDQLAWEVEKIFHANPNLSDTVETCRLHDIAMAFGDNGSSALHGAILTFEVTYVTFPNGNEEEGKIGIVEPFTGFEPETGIKNEEKYTKIEDTHV
ncbi:hypothetical protein BAnh1_09580 [Bartonella australis AUST/NH1]|uniref:Phage protein n=1 Tax=Bartonella australis (strain Aust/NH1) TaxID=1094489 RepID=M1P4P7_BARAA|nr:hypothetical protein [Bartonella australis]AGF74830.1 hypothetical protein BAnh1_09580 [Bartonella australis AUST/NH1]